MRRTFGFIPARVFDTVIAARLLGIREFSLAALVQRFFGVELPKGSQKANWAQRPLPARMAEYAMNDTHYLLPLAEKLEAELIERDRLEWLRESCDRAIAQASVQRQRDDDELWRVTGAGTLRGRPAAILRALWHWRDSERARRIVRRFTFCKISSSSWRQRLLMRAKRRSSAIFPRGAGVNFLTAANKAMESPESGGPRGTGGETRLRPTTGNGSALSLNCDGVAITRRRNCRSNPRSSLPAECDCRRLPVDENQQRKSCSCRGR